MSHTTDYLAEVIAIANDLPHEAVEDLARSLCFLRERKGKLYIVGLGGSLANSIHMAADLRKLCEIDAEAFDNIAELTARANDEGFGAIYGDWLSRSTSKDALMVLSVGGGTPHVSQAIVYAIDRAKENGSKVWGIVGPNLGYTGEKADITIRVPVENRLRITPHSESFQAVIWHCLVCHPLLQRNETKW